MSGQESARVGNTYAQETTDDVEAHGRIGHEGGARPTESVRFINMTTPASFGVEWSAGDHATRYQLANPRGTRTLLFGAKPDGADQWMTTRVGEPARFGMDTPPRTFAQFRTIADAFINA